MFLYNRINRKELVQSLMNEPFARATVSFYRYFIIGDPKAYRDRLYKNWSQMNCLGRIYVAREGINAQMSVPAHFEDHFIKGLDAIPGLKDIPLRKAVEDNGKSFYKLTIKVRNKIVADGLPDHAYDVTNVGRHLTAIEFHNALKEPGAVVVDMRNHYESEIGKFENAVCADADTFREGIFKVRELLKGKEDKKILLYCTGGIRCEKASAFLRHHGFTNVNQLYGGIIEYAHTIKKEGLASRFTGKNFVFDGRLGEDIDGNVISRCHQCGAPSNTHTNCANDECHRLFIQCERCAGRFEGCCSEECRKFQMSNVEA